MATIQSSNFGREMPELGTVENARILVGTQLDGRVFLLLADAGGRVFANIGLSGPEATAFANQLQVAAVNTEFAAEAERRSMH